jgi:hypothetical protein
MEVINVRQEVALFMRMEIESRICSIVRIPIDVDNTVSKIERKDASDVRKKHQTM